MSKKILTNQSAEKAEKTPSSKWRYLVSGVKAAVFISLFSITYCAIKSDNDKNFDNIPQSGFFDMHAHTAGIGVKGSGIRISESIKGSYKFPIYLRAFGIKKEELEIWGDAIVLKKISERIEESLYVDGSVILAMDGYIDNNGELDEEKTEIYIPNDFVSEETSKYENLYFGASVNPNRIDALQRLEKTHKQGAILMKWLPSIMNIDPSDEIHIDFYKKLVELDMPLLVHVGDEHSFTHADNGLAQPEKLELPLSLGVRVIAAHVGTLGEKDNIPSHERLMGMFKKYPNLYADISSLTQVNKRKYLKEVLKNDDLKGRLLYGSDMPLINTALVSPLYFLSHLTVTQIFDILFTDNAYDKDIKIKYALGVDDGIFLKPKEFFHIDDK